MKARSRRRQSLLFVSALVLPSFAVVAFGLKMVAQERELAEKRKDEARQQLVSDVQKDLLARIERIKTQEISANPDATSPPSNPTDPAVVLVGWEQQGRLILPWDRDRNAAQFKADIAAPEFSRKIEAAESDEAHASEIYRNALDGARNPNQSAYAKFLLARTLDNTGREEAFRRYRELLLLPSEVVDDQGMPFAFYAAERLSNAGASQAEVARRLEEDLDDVARLSPWQAYFLLGIFERVTRPESGAYDALRRRISAIEQAISLQQDFASLRLAPASWISYGAEPWLIGVSYTRPENQRLVVALHSRTVLGAVETQYAPTAPGLRIVPETKPGEPLGDSLPDLRLSFAGVSRSVGISPRSFYLLSVILVLGLTLVGGYLVWRDTRRELHLADLRSQFVANISHELKTPLTSIRMFAEALQMKGLADERKRDEYLDTIVNESERLTRLLNNVLDFSRIERGQRNYRMAAVNLGEVVDDAARTMKYPLARLGFDLHLEVSADVPPIHVDRDAVEQAILNLLTNAMKYSGKSREIGLRLARQNGSAVIQVSDHGVGIPKSEQSRIFEKFYRVPSAENHAIAGTGLGLALVSHIATAHGGTVDVESEPGQGSTFSLSLPLNMQNGDWKDEQSSGC